MNRKEITVLGVWVEAGRSFTRQRKLKGCWVPERGKLAGDMGGRCRVQRGACWNSLQLQPRLSESRGLPRGRGRAGTAEQRPGEKEQQDDGRGLQNSGRQPVADLVLDPSARHCWTSPGRVLTTSRSWANRGMSLIKKTQLSFKLRSNS